MVLYDCELCIFSTDIKSHYDRHLNTRKHMDNIIMNGEEEEKKLALKKKEHKRTQKKYKN